jgi:hypothetical protein
MYFGGERRELDKCMKWKKGNEVRASGIKVRKK